MWPILFDEKFVRKGAQFRERGYKAITVEELRALGLKLENQYSIIKFAEEKNMVLVTNHDESRAACSENNVPCVLVKIDDPTDEIIIDDLKKFGIL